ncbi:MAG TPA: hypothetical protein VK890_01570, partial [Bacteroidia bacterium]|nr:hypothetical protein [Bacteroidia bacterium]
TNLPQFGGPTIYPKWFTTDSVYYNGICGTADGFYAPQNALYDSILPYKPYFTPSFTTLTGVGHTSASWGPYFSPYSKDPITGLSKYQTFMKLFPVAPAVVVNPAPVPVPVPTPIGKFLVRSTFAIDFTKKTTIITNMYSDSTSTVMVLQ